MCVRKLNTRFDWECCFLGNCFPSVYIKMASVFAGEGTCNLLDLIQGRMRNLSLMLFGGDIKNKTAAFKAAVYIYAIGTWTGRSEGTTYFKAEHSS